MKENFSSGAFRNLPESSLTEVYRNHRIKTPFDFADLAFFLDRSGDSGAVKLRVLPFHHRSADLGVSTVMHERDAKRHHVFLQIDIKGGGFVFPEEFEMRKEGFSKGDFAQAPEAVIHAQSKETPWGYDTLGLFDERMIETVTENADRLSAAGARTEAIAGAYRTDTVYLNGQPKKVRELKAETAAKFLELAAAAEDPKRKKALKEMASDIKKEFDPMLAVRLMRSVFRVRDMKESLAESGGVEQVLAMIEEACKNLNYEAEALGRPERFDGATPEGRERWARFVSFWYGKNAGIMHREGLAHIYLHMGNLTLAGEIVDLDSMGEALASRKFRGKPENKAKWLDAGDIVRDGRGKIVEGSSYREKPFFRETPEGCVFANPDFSYYKNPDPRFGLPKPVMKDIRDVCYSTGALLRNILSKLPGGRDIDPKKLAGEMTRGYMEGLGDKTALEPAGVTAEKLKKVFAEVATEVVGRGRSYDPIPPDDADWA